MESETQSAPPVVAVVVVHDPGSWFDETLDAFAAQDYPNLRFLFLDTGSERTDDAPPMAERVAARLPDALAAASSAAHLRARCSYDSGGFFIAFACASP